MIQMLEMPSTLYKKVRPKKLDSDGLCRSDRIDLMLELLLLCRDELEKELGPWVGREPLTLREVAECIGVSFEYVRQIEARAFSKIREARKQPTPDEKTTLQNAFTED